LLPGGADLHGELGGTVGILACLVSLAGRDEGSRKIHVQSGLGSGEGRVESA
jgi:hypothetical protein